MLVIFGYGSKLSDAVQKRLDYAARVPETFRAAQMDEPPLDAERYLFTAGVLIGKPVNKMTNAERVSMLDINFASVVSACETILDANDRARICIIGSESGYRGSYDKIYAGSKAALHAYVETRAVGQHQQLVGISPGIIEDCGMTERRTDRDALDKRRAAHPKGRFLKAEEVARVAVFALYDSSEYLCNTVIRLHGGEQCR